MLYNESDYNFKRTCSDILMHDYMYETRPIWEDTREHAKVIKKFGVVNRYALDKSFPALTLRPINFKACVDELLWIYQKKSNNIKDLNSKIWDQWADNNGSIGLAYGYQVANCFRRVQTKYPDGYSCNELLDQIDYVIHELKYNPFSRRIIINLYNIQDLEMMNLDPCCYSCTFNVIVNKNGDKVLNMLLNQRSNDVILANNWNVVQYSVLQCLLAHICDMKVGELVHVIADAHIYDRHIDIAKKLIKRNSFEAPTLWINPEKKNFYDFTVDDFKLIGYEYNEQIKNIPVAV